MAVDYSLKLDGVEGEFKDSKHQNEIEISSFSFGATQTGSFSTGGGGTGKCQIRTFISPYRRKRLARSCCYPAPRQIIFRRQSLPAGKEQQEFLKYTFTDLVVSSFQTGGSSETPMGQVSLNSAKIEVEYKEQKPDGTLGGSVKAGYDLKQTNEV